VQCEVATATRGRVQLVINININNGLVIRALGYRSRGPGSIPSATRFSEM
jgi:hypothetical protein